MVYVTTREERKPYTAQQVLQEDRGDCGGLFVPSPEPVFSMEELEALWALPFTARIARVLNGLFGTAITQWDVDFCVGRHPVRLISLPQKILLAQCWHNWEGSLSYLVRVLASRLRSDGKPVAGEWTEVSVRFALLLAIAGEARQYVDFSRGERLDVSAISGEFYGVVSAWYARAWGAPIGSIVCCCNENHLIWELFHRGLLHTDGVTSETVTPLADVAVPIGLERLIYAVGGTSEVSRYLDAVRRGGVYVPGDDIRERLTRGMAVSVVGRQRMEATLRGVHACGTLLSPYDGLCHGGLQDHRTRTGSREWALIFSERSPKLDRAVAHSAFEGYSPIPEDLEKPL